MLKTAPRPTRSAANTRSAFDWPNDDARTFLRRGYLLDGISPEERVRQIADHAEDLLGLPGFGDRFFEYMSRGYYSLASPIWSNFGLDRGLPISCFGSYIGDSMEAILDTHAEVGMMTKVGGGTSGYFGDVRPRGAPITNNGTSNGTYPFAQLFDTIINMVSQGETRRGHFAGYIDIEHADAREWLNIQTEGDAIQTMYYGVVVGDAWLEAMIDGDGIKHLGRAVRFAKRHRAIGIRMLGWHSYLQSNMIPFESTEANLIGAEVARAIKERSQAASADLADRFGEPDVLRGTGRRNATTMAVAPTKSSSFILGQVSPSIEPVKSNYFVQDRAKIKVTHKNPYLKALLAEKGHDTPDTWDRIALRDGSVQHLGVLTSEEKAVFKTFSEISPMTIVNQATSRQKHIDQSQSLNLAIDPAQAPVKDINRLYLAAWEKGVKSLYYQHSVNATQRFSRDLLACQSCEG